MKKKKKRHIVYEYEYLIKWWMLKLKHFQKFTNFSKYQVICSNWTLPFLTGKLEEYEFA